MYQMKGYPFSVISFVGIVSKIRVIEMIDYTEVCFVNLKYKAFYIIQTM